MLNSQQCSLASRNLLSIYSFYLDNVMQIEFKDLGIKQFLLDGEALDGLCQFLIEVNKVETCVGV